MSIAAGEGWQNSDDFVDSYLVFANELIHLYNTHYQQTPAGRNILTTTWTWEHLD